MAQEFLDRITTSIATGSFETYRAAHDLPFVAVTRRATSICHDERDLRAQFDRMCHALTGEGQRQVLRIARSDKDLEPGLKYCMYDTHVFEGTYRVSESFSSILLLRESGTAWLCAMATTRVTQLSWESLRDPAYSHHPRDASDASD